jgi:hypothetical protein
VVTNPLGEPLADASVILVDLQTYTLTGAGGRFLFREVPAGVHTVQVLRRGCTPWDQAVRVAEDSTTDVQLRYACFAFTPPVHVPSALGTLQGTVFGPDWGPVRGARVAIADLDRTTTVDSGGRFCFRDVPHGRHSVWIGAVGQAVWMQFATVGADSVTNLKIWLRPCDYDSAGPVGIAYPRPAPEPEWLKLDQPPESVRIVAVQHGKIGTESLTLYGDGRGSIATYWRGLREPSFSPVAFRVPASTVEGLLQELYDIGFFQLEDWLQGGGRIGRAGAGRIRVGWDMISDAGGVDLRVELGRYAKSVHFLPLPGYCAPYLLRIWEQMMAIERARGLPGERRDARADSGSLPAPKPPASGPGAGARRTD